jgi:hypothetical protein
MCIRIGCRVFGLQVAYEIGPQLVSDSTGIGTGGEVQQQRACLRRPIRQSNRVQTITSNGRSRSMDAVGHYFRTAGRLAGRSGGGCGTNAPRSDLLPFGTDRRVTPASPNTQHVGIRFMNRCSNAPRATPPECPAAPNMPLPQHAAAQYA